MTEIGPRLRNALLAITAIGAVLVAYDKLTGGEWVALVAGMIKGLVG